MSEESLAQENARLRRALRKIADANSGPWGWIAHDALRGRDVAEDVHQLHGSPRSGGDPGEHESDGDGG